MHSGNINFPTKPLFNESEAYKAQSFERMGRATCLWQVKGSKLYASEANHPSIQYMLTIITTYAQVKFKEPGKAL